MSNQTNKTDAKFLPSVRKEAALSSSSKQRTTKTFEERIIEKIGAADAHDSTGEAKPTEQSSVLPFRSRIIQNLPDGSQKITTTTTITHPDGRKEVTTHEVIVPSGTDTPEDYTTNKVVCLEQVDDAVEPIPLVQRVEMFNEDEVKQKQEQLHHNHHHNNHHKRRKKRSAVHRAPDVGPSFEEEQPHEPHRSACTTDTSATTDNDHSNTTSTTSNPSRAIQIHDEEAAPTTSCPCTTDEDALVSIYMPEATLVDDNPREYKFLKKNIAIVASTLLVVVVLIVVLFVTTEKKDPKEQNTTETIGDQKPPTITSSEPESYFSPDPEERFFVCEDINDEMEGCLDADCVGDSSRCKCKAYHRVKATKEITGYCESCTVCDDLLIMIGFECSNLAKGYPEEMRKEAHPHGPLGSNQCASLETNAPPSRAPFGWDKPFFLCFTSPSDPTQENCVEATCLTNNKDCSCQMYTRWAASKNIIEYCKTCEVCGPLVPIPLAGDCGMSPADMGGVEPSCDDYPLINATSESELFKIDGAV
jgi:hypothetical protein